MPQAMRADSTLASENFSRQHKYSFKSWVAAVLTAATLLMFAGTASASYMVEAVGVSEWLGAIVERSITAVAERMPETQSDESAERVIKVISEKLFDGYNVDSVKISSGVIRIVLSPEKSPNEWKVEVQTPQIQDPPAVDHGGHLADRSAS